MIEFIDSLIEKIVNRTKCSDICIKIDNIYWQCLDGNVQETMKTMVRKCYTHIPILENNKVIGIFDENSVFNYIASDEIVLIDSNLKFSDIRNFISISDREMEKFVFVRYHSYVDELEEIIENSFSKGERVGMSLLTSDGKPTSSLMGIITPWDIIKSNK